MQAVVENCDVEFPNAWCVEVAQGDVWKVAQERRQVIGAGVYHPEKERPSYVQPNGARNH
eukprot:590117-Pelagomonas_calceolata.AAC.1